MNKKSALQAKYDILVDQYEGDDDLALEDVHHEMHKFWRFFLDAGFDVDQIAKMLSLQDAWGNYDVLTARGASFEIPLFIENFDRNFVDENWALFISRGANPDDLAKKVFVSIKSYADMKEVIERGASVNFVIELLNSEADEASSVSEPLQIFSYLRRNGMTEEELNNWIDANLDHELLESILGEYSDAWMSIGVNAEDYIDTWFKRGSEFYFGPDNLELLPKYITAERFINYFPMETIIKETQHFGSFSDFLEYEFKESGCDINELSKRFLDEIGYSNESRYIDAMFGLIFAGATNIDIEKFVELACNNRVDKCSKEYYYDELQWKGIDEKIICKLLS